MVSRPDSQSVAGLLDAGLRGPGDRVAIVTATERVTVDALARRTNQVGRYLQARGLTRGRRVAISLRRGVDACVALLGIVKSGAAYVPLAPEWPASWRARILADLAPDAILADAHTADGAWAPASRLIHVPEVWRDVDGVADDPLLSDHHADDLLAIIYTSGTTGKPKGVMVRTGAVANQMLATAAACAVTDRDVAVLHRSPTVVGSVWDYFGPLSAGAACVLASDDDVRDPIRLWQLIVEHGATLCAAAPMLVRALLRHAAAAGEVCPSLRACITGGDYPPKEIATLWTRVFPSATLVNTYGTTETLYVAQHHATAGLDDAWSLPVGVACCGTYFRVLDETLHDVPSGDVGEIYVGGAGLARGYVGDPAATALRFVPEAGGGRAYRTGDVGWVDGDGRLQLLGRVDNQIKVNGFRVEIEQVEAVLAGVDGVDGAVVDVVHNEAGDHRLIGYVVVRADRVGLDDVRAAVARVLPSHMVPARLYRISDVPRNANGKVDRAGLRDGRARHLLAAGS